jgi:hypothetical protein
MGEQISRSYAGFGVMMAVLVGGCGAGAIGGRAQGKPYAVTENALQLNGLVANGLVANGLRMNGLRMNGLRMNGLRMNGLSINDLSQPDSITVLSYLVSCALPEGHQITMTIAGQPMSFAGGVGVAPELETGTLSNPASQEWVSGCMMARTNSLPIHVLISMRGPLPALVPSASEVTDFSVGDTAFYGNLFSAPAKMKVCSLSADSQDPGLAAIGRDAGNLDYDFPGFVSDGSCFLNSICTLAPAGTYASTCGTSAHPVSAFVRPTDLPELCGDGLCTRSESAATCPQDCQGPAPGPSPLATVF